MTTHRQQSFLATLWLNDRPINTLATLLGKPAWVNRVGDVPVTVPHLASTVRNDSAMLSCQSGVVQAAMTFYFRHTSEGYRLYVREPGEHFGKAVVAHHDKCLGLAPTDKHTPSLFTLHRPGGEPVTLRDLLADTHLVTLSSDGAGISPSRRANTSHQYLAARSKAPQVWFLKIAERSVPWLSSPDET
ncbi:hypothetical protein [Pseudomonas sp. RIT-PI-S]|uniref:hypothetical protein n=1 Tax=Pseudomonas sp. RIT-PI-S TaxID=3035295 RepID=UPI0021DB6E2C|nr:hypothetical protein [Pseudomonas sp. RIT-PI-S]